MLGTPLFPSIFGMALLTSFAIPYAISFADDKKPSVSLTLTDVTAVKSKDGDPLFTIKLTLVNATGAEIIVPSRFSSALDFLDLIVTDTEGKLVAQQGNTFHQSPRFKPQNFSIKPGESAESMVFPISGIGRVGDKLNVQLLGVLPDGIVVRSQTIKVAVKGS